MADMWCAVYVDHMLYEVLTSETNMFDTLIDARLYYAKNPSPSATVLGFINKQNGELVWKRPYGEGTDIPKDKYEDEYYTVSKFSLRVY